MCRLLICIWKNMWINMCGSIIYLFISKGIYGFCCKNICSYKFYYLIKSGLNNCSLFFLYNRNIRGSLFKVWFNGLLMWGF